jgi:hypothetical protein
MSCRAFRLDPPPPLSHTPTFTPSPLPLGWERCAVCHQLVDLAIWLRTTCPGKPA